MDYENLTPQYRIEEYLEAIVEGWAEATQYPYPDYPSWRIEEFLDAFITYIWEDGDHPRHPCPEPAWRLEECLRAIYDVMTGAATPWPFPLPTTNRIEEYLAAIHAYLADGTELPVPEPVWRIEQWLAYVLDGVKQGGGVEKTVSGTMVHITDALAKAALSVLASIEPIQDLHGYSHPWPAGGGKNKLKLPSVGATINGVIFTINSDGTVTANGTATANADFYFVGANGVYADAGIASGNYKANGIPSVGSTCAMFIAENGEAAKSVANGNETSISIDSTKSYRIFVRVGNGATVNNLTLYPMIRLASDTDATFAPYSNICPISGRTGLSVYVGPTTAQADATTYAVDWTTEAGTVYGGTLDVVSGVLTVTRKTLVVDGTQNIVSTSSNRFFILVSDAKVVNASNQTTYAGVVCDRLPSKTWASLVSADIGCSPVWGKGVAFKSPDITTAEDWNTYFTNNPTQFSYELATPLTYQLSAQEVQMLLGENYVWSSSGDTVSVTYYAEGNANPLQSLNILLGGNYRNPKTADDVSDKEALEIILGGNK